MMARWIDVSSQGCWKMDLTVTWFMLVWKMESWLMPSERNKKRHASMRTVTKCKTVMLVLVMDIIKLVPNWWNVQTSDSRPTCNYPSTGP